MMNRIDQISKTNVNPILGKFYLSQLSHDSLVDLIGKCLHEPFGQRIMDIYSQNFSDDVSTMVINHLTEIFEVTCANLDKILFIEFEKRDDLVKDLLDDTCEQVYDVVRSVFAGANYLIAANLYMEAVKHIDMVNTKYRSLDTTSHFDQWKKPGLRYQIFAFYFDMLNQAILDKSMDLDDILSLFEKVIQHDEAQYYQTWKRAETKNVNPRYEVIYKQGMMNNFIKSPSYVLWNQILTISHEDPRIRTVLLTELMKFQNLTQRVDVLCRILIKEDRYEQAMGLYEKFPSMNLSLFVAKALMDENPTWVYEIGYKQLESLFCAVGSCIKQRFVEMLGKVPTEMNDDEFDGLLLRLEVHYKRDGDLLQSGPDEIPNFKKWLGIFVRLCGLKLDKTYLKNGRTLWVQMLKKCMNVLLDILHQWIIIYTHSLKNLPCFQISSSNKDSLFEFIVIILYMLDESKK